MEGGAKLEPMGSGRGPYRSTTYLGALRARRGFTQKRAAQLLNVTRGFLAGVECGSRPLPGPLKYRLSTLYNVSAQEVARLYSMSAQFVTPRR